MSLGTFGGGAAWEKAPAGGGPQLDCSAGAQRGSPVCVGTLERQLPLVLRARRGNSAPSARLRCVVHDLLVATRGGASTSDQATRFDTHLLPIERTVFARGVLRLAVFRGRQGELF
jgi:hypothetical protein